MPNTATENIVTTYAKRWNLSNLNRIDYRGPNYLFTCESACRGPCVLKIGKPYGEVKNECAFLETYRGSRFCEVIEADNNAGVLLLERILPDTRLREEPSLERRLEVFSALLGAGQCPRFHREAPCLAAFPSYLNWVSHIAAFMRNRNDYKVYVEMCMAHSWNVESQEEPNMAEVRFAERMLP